MAPIIKQALRNLRCVYRHNSLRREENTVLPDRSRFTWVDFKHGGDNSISEAKESRVPTVKDTSASISHSKLPGSQRANTCKESDLRD